MADLEIEGSFEEQWGIMKSAVRAHDKTLYGNGQPGVVDFISQTRGQFKLIIALLTLILAALGVYAALEANRQAKANLLPWQRPSTTGEVTTAHRGEIPQDAGIDAIVESSLKKTRYAQDSRPRHRLSSVLLPLNQKKGTA